MKFLKKTIDYDHLLALISSRGLTDREFCKKLWGEKTHLNTRYFLAKPDVRVSKLIKMAEILSCKLDDFFPQEEGSSEISSNYVTSSEARMKELASENAALHLLLDEKDKRIADLQNVNSVILRKLDSAQIIGRPTDE